MRPVSSSFRRRAVAATLPLLVLAAGATTSSSSFPAPPSPSILPWLQVRPVDLTLNPNSTRRFIIADEYGREVALHGACVENEERNLPGNFTQRSQDPADFEGGRCPDNRNSFEEPPICEVDAGKGRYNQSSSDLSQNDFAQVRALGFNIVRLCLSWSEMEPTPGVYSQTYIERVAQMVGWAEEQGVYVILDMHEDDYSQFIYPGPNETGIPPILVPSGGAGNDGAPTWAIDTQGFPSWALLGIGNLNLAMMAAFQAFWDNAIIPGIPQGSAPGPGLQDHYIGAIAALAARFVNSSAVAGYEIINEPQPGFTLDPFTFATNCLYALYRRTVQGITGIRDGLPTCTANATASLNCSYPDLGIRDTRHLFFAEPSAVRNLLDFSPQISVPWTNYTQIVHTPHTYTHVFTIDRILLPYGINISFYPPSFTFAYATAWEEANAMNSAVFVTEFGTGVDDDPNTLVHTLDAQDLYMTGATLWSWKSNCMSETPGGCDWAWTVYFPVGGNTTTEPIPQNGALDPERAWLLSRTQVRGSVGEMIAYSFNRTTRSFYAFFNASAAQGERAAAAAAAAGMASSSSSSASLPVSLVVTPETFTPSLPRALSANGTVTEVYIPPSVAFSVAVTGGASVQQIVTWPDGARTVYVAPPSAGGVYGVLVWNGTSTSAEAEAMIMSGGGAATSAEEVLARLRPAGMVEEMQRTTEAARELLSALRERQGAVEKGACDGVEHDGASDPAAAAECALARYLEFVRSNAREAGVKLGRELPIR